MTERRRLPLMARLALWIGGLLFSALLPALVLVAHLPPADAILLAVLLVVVPVLSIAQLPLMREAAVERMPAYWGSIATLLLVGSACWLVGTRAGGPAALGIVGLSPARLLAWSLALVAGGLFIILVFRQLAIWTGVQESSTLRELLPRTRQERGVFVLLSVAAGVGEELAYRGYSIPMLASWLGVGGAAALTSIVFGILHGYQGVLGTVRTALMGGLLAWGFLASGSLWPAVLAHAAIDVASGVVFGERLLPPPGSHGVPDHRASL